MGTIESDIRGSQRKIHDLTLNENPVAALSTWLSMPSLLACWNMSSTDEPFRISDLSGQGRCLEMMNSFTPSTGVSPYVSLTAAQWLFRSPETLGDGVAWSGAGKDLTVAIWVRPQQAVAATHYYIDRYYTTPANHRVWRIACGATGYPNCLISVDGTTGAGSFNQVDSTKIMERGVWSFLCMRFTHSVELAIFHNMVKTTVVAAVVASLFSNHAKLQINGFNWGAGSPGIMDVGLTAMYRQALSDASIYQLFQSSRGWYGV